MGKTLVFAHRGFSGKAPENTMAAFELAKDVGADGIEIDVHVTRDNQLVVCHDERIDRTTDGSGVIAELTYDDLTQFDAGSWFSPDFSGERLPTLAQVCEFVAGWGGFLNIELKTNVNPYPGIEQAVLEVLRQYKIEEQVVISSFNHYTLHRWESLSSKAPSAVLYSAVLFEPWQYAENAGFAGVHPRYRTVDAEFVAQAHRAGVAVRPWTVNSPAELARLKDCEVDAVITDRPDLALQQG